VSRGFVIEFSVNTATSRNDAPRVEQFRVIVQDEDIRTFQKGGDAFGGDRWIGELEPDRSSVVSKVSIIAWAFDGYINAAQRDHDTLPNGFTLIDIGTIKREA